jgi:hypothetical protein
MDEVQKPSNSECSDMVFREESMQKGSIWDICSSSVSGCYGEPGPSIQEKNEKIQLEEELTEPCQTYKKIYRSISL